jgi:hypothetical protein
LSSTLSLSIAEELEEGEIPNPFGEEEQAPATSTTTVPEPQSASSMPKIDALNILSASMSEDIQSAPLSTISAASKQTDSIGCDAHVDRLIYPAAQGPQPRRNAVGAWFVHHVYFQCVH